MPQKYILNTFVHRFIKLHSRVKKRDVLLILFYTIRGQVLTSISTIGLMYAYLLLASGLRILNAWTHCLVQTGTAKKR
jgi:hypothetical protein